MKKIPFAFLLCFALAGCKKELVELEPYKVNTIQNKGGFGCVYKAKAPGRPEITFTDFCGKYKTGSVVFEVKK